MPGKGGRIDAPNINQAVVAAPPAPEKKATKKAATTAASPAPVPAQEPEDAASGG